MANGIDTTSNSSKSGLPIAELNAKLPLQPRRDSVAQGNEWADAHQGSGIESGLFKKETLSASDRGPALLGKVMEDMGTPPWDAPPRDSVGGKASDTFGAGTSHVIKNG